MADPLLEYPHTTLPPFPTVGADDSWSIIPFSIFESRFKMHYATLGLVCPPLSLPHLIRLVRSSVVDGHLPTPGDIRHCLQNYGISSVQHFDQFGPPSPLRYLVKTFVELLDPTSICACLDGTLRPLEGYLDRRGGRIIPAGDNNVEQESHDLTCMVFRYTKIHNGEIYWTCCDSAGRWFFASERAIPRMIQYNISDNSKFVFQNSKEEASETKTEEAKEEASEDGATKTIVVEHCKQCNSFKTRAVQVKDGLATAVPGVNVLLNPDKPRRGCFEIREKDGETFISLLDMKRPFTPMKDLDMDKVISDIIDKIKS